VFLNTCHLLLLSKELCVWICLCHVWYIEPLGRGNVSDHHTMDSINYGLAKAKSSKNKSLAKARNSRGMSARACSAKAMN